MARLVSTIFNEPFTYDTHIDSRPTIQISRFFKVTFRVLLSMHVQSMLKLKQNNLKYSDIAFGWIKSQAILPVFSILPLANIIC